MHDHAAFLNSLNRVLGRINAACVKSGRNPQEVILMAVTKTHAAMAADWALEAGLSHIGENRVQELAAKRPGARLSGGCWELIGPLQSNKVRLALEHADRIQTVDRLKIVRILDRHCEGMGRERYPVLMQVNTGRDPAKHGCEVEEAPRLMEAILESGHLELEGVMTIGELTDEEARIRATFSRLRELRDQLEGRAGRSLPVLSMGMTGDLEWAIEEGSTLIRVGTALFGARE